MEAMELKEPPGLGGGSAALLAYLSAFSFPITSVFPGTHLIFPLSGMS